MSTRFIPPHQQDVQRWYANLDERQRKVVGRWLERNAPPNEWKETPLDYAYCEMPVALLTLA